ncbi:MAG TPA: ABC transporter permease [Vicinamibacterales bacterium]
MSFKHILRRLIHFPMFTAITVATLGIGIGGNSAIFTVIEGVLLKPLPYPNPQELVEVDHAAPGMNIPQAGAAPFLHFTYKDQSHAFAAIGMWRPDAVNLTGVGDPEEVRTLDVTEGVLNALDVHPLMGRVFSPTDDSPSSQKTAILTYGYWRSRFGGDPGVLGRRIVLDSEPREIVGVLPESFQFLDRKFSLVLPLRLDPAKVFLGNFSFDGIARLKPGVSLAEANADVARMIPIALRRYPPFPGYNAKMFEDARLVPALRPLKDELVGDIGKVLWILMGTLAMVLLIACANVANLLLVRAEGRQQELAIRAALGADRAQIARELLLESLTLGIGGGLFGLALAYGALRTLTALAPANVPRLDALSIDVPVLLFTLAISVVAALLFGSIPIFKYAGPRVGTALRMGGRTASDSKERHRTRSTLVVVQVALALVLLISSGLMIRTFYALKHVNPGFERPEEVETMRISIPSSEVRDPIQVVRMDQAILDKIAAIPGVSAAGMASHVPMTGQGWHDAMYAEDHSYSESRIPPLRAFKIASPGFFKAMGNRMVAGRDFTWTDVFEERHVAIVSENLARELWQTPQAAIGKRVNEGMKATWREIVGVVADERDDGVDQKAPAIVCWPVLMDKFAGDQPFVNRTMSVAIRSSRAGTSGLLRDVGTAVWSVDPNLPLANVRTLQEIYDRSLARTSFALVMLAIAGAMALLLGVAGLYGVISYSVSQRTREIGIRMALGARYEEVTRMFVRHGLMLAAVGIACGLTASFVLARLMSSLLFGVSATDAVTYAGVSFGLAAAAVVASYVPARRATLIDPVHALRAE